MPRTIRFHLDENGSRAIASGLRRRDVDVTTTPEVGLVTTPSRERDGFSEQAGQPQP